MARSEEACERESGGAARRSGYRSLGQDLIGSGAWFSSAVLPTLKAADYHNGQITTVLPVVFTNGLAMITFWVSRDREATGGGRIAGDCPRVGLSWCALSAAGLALGLSSLTFSRVGALGAAASLAYTRQVEDASL